MENAEVILIRGPMVLSPGRVSANIACPPLGIAYLASFLKNRGIHSIKVIDAFGEAPFENNSYEDYNLVGLTNENVVEQIPSTAKIIGFSCMFSNEWINLKQLINLVKNKFPDAVTVLGGEHATALPKYTLESSQGLDYVIQGEGENSFHDFVTFFLDRKGSINKIPGLAFFDNEYRENPTTRERKIDNFPWPAWDQLPINNYLDNGLAMTRAKGLRSIPVLASRGCPYVCKFCSNEQMWGTLYRARTPQDLINEIKHHKKLYNLNSFELHDLTFIINRKWFIQFAELLIKEDLNLKWELQNTRSEAIDPEVIDLLVKSGCTRLCLAPDSGSEASVADMMKKVDLKHVVKCVKWVAKTKISLKINLIIGLPNERHMDIFRTILYGMSLSAKGAPSVIFYHFVPYPGSDYFKLLQKRKLLPKEGDQFDRFLVSNIYNELSKVKSYCSKLSSLSLKVYLYLSFGGSFFSFLVFNPRATIKMFGRIFSQQGQNNLESAIASFLIRKSNTKST